MLSLTKTLLRPSFFRPLCSSSFCQIKNTSPDPNDPIQKQVSSFHPQTSNDEAQRSRASYIEQYQARQRNVQSYRNTLEALETRIGQIQSDKMWNNLLISKLVNWFTNRSKNEELMIERLQKAIMVTKQIASKFWSDHTTLLSIQHRQKQLIYQYKHRDFGNQLIRVSKMLSKTQINEEQDQKVKEGVELTLRMLNMVLVKYEFVSFKPSPKEKFNAGLHEEVKRVKSKQAKDTIVKVVQEGWMYKEEVLYHAKVIVSQ